MATKKKSVYAKNSKDYAEKQAAKAKSKSIKQNAEDVHVKKTQKKSARIRDVGQKPPPGYRRTGGLYFAKNANDAPIRSKTTEAQRALFYANKPKFIGVGDKNGWVAQAANQGMYNGETSEVNFRKSAQARKLLDADGGTYSQEYMDGLKKKHAGEKTKMSKSRYIMAIGQDGHAR